MLPSPTQVIVVLALVLALGGIWYFRGRNRWREAASDRLYLGVPWGTLLLVAINLAFYLFAQGGLHHWEDPNIYPFISWTYFYPLGMLTSGIAHGSAGHIVSNVTATLVFGPIAEYAWGHYPGGSVDADTGSGSGTDGTGGDFADEPWHDDELMPDSNGNDRGLLGHPFVRALVVFPVAVLLVSFITSAFSIAPSLGFSGAVYALAGFAVVRYPIPTLLGGIGASVLGVVYDAITNPIVRGTFESGPPSLPSWANVGFQAHALGFLLGALAAIALLSARNREVPAERVFFGVFAWGMSFSLWLIAFPQSTDVYHLYRGAGVVALVVVTSIVTFAVAGSDEPLPRPLADVSLVPSRKALGIGWLSLVALLLVGMGGGLLVLSPSLALAALLFCLVLALPALPLVLPDGLDVSPVGYRHVAIGALLGITILVALPGVPLSTMAVDAEPVPNDTAVEIEDYTIRYAENATSDRGPAFETGVNESEAANASTVDGVILVSEERGIWTPAVRKATLAHSGNETVVVGGLGWRETVRAERTGWNVAGNDTVYVVDLYYDGETVRSFTSEPMTADVRIDGHAVTVVPAEDAFRLRISDGGDVVDTVAIPTANESTTVGEIRIQSESDGDARHVYVETEDSRAVVAEEETYD